MIGKKQAISDNKARLTAKVVEPLRVFMLDLDWSHGEVALLS